MRISDWSSDVCSSDLAQRMAHRPDMLGRTRRHVADAEMLEHAERDGGEEALRLRRPEEHDLIFIIGEAQRIDPARRRLGHMVERHLPAERKSTRLNSSY